MESACSCDKATWLHFSGFLLGCEHTGCNQDHSKGIVKAAMITVTPIETLNGNHNSPWNYKGKGHLSEFTCSWILNISFLFKYVKLLCTKFFLACAVHKQCWCQEISFWVHKTLNVLILGGKEQKEPPQSNTIKVLISRICEICTRLPRPHNSCPCR